MTDPRRIAKDEPERIVLNNISEFGWHAVNIIEDDGCPPWTFTIGLYETYGFPELIILGRSRSTAVVRLVEPFGLLPSLDIGESGARARLAFRILRRGADESVVTSM
jgi:hypothetical protein